MKIRKKHDIKIYKLYNSNNEKFIFKILKVLTQKIIFSNILIYSQINPHKYLKENQTNHVLYRVTPYFEGNNELANGVNIEAYSIEDNGKLHFNVYVYNVQDRIVIDYATGKSRLAE